MVASLHTHAGASLAGIRASKEVLESFARKMAGITVPAGRNLSSRVEDMAHLGLVVLVERLVVGITVPASSPASHCEASPCVSDADLSVDLPGGSPPSAPPSSASGP